MLVYTRAICGLYEVVGSSIPSEGPRTRCLRALTPKIIPLIVFGTRDLKYWVLGPSGCGCCAASYSQTPGRIQKNRFTFGLSFLGPKEVQDPDSGGSTFWLLPGSGLPGSLPVWQLQQHRNKGIWSLKILCSCPDTGPWFQESLAVASFRKVGPCMSKQQKPPAKKPEQTKGSM